MAAIEIDKMDILQKIKLSRLPLLIAIVLIICGCSDELKISERSPATGGTLRVHSTNPRYFTDGSGNAIYLTGSHTWSNFKNIGPTDPPIIFDYDGYLDFLTQYNHNFIRLWTWELTKFVYPDQEILYAEPLPWSRSGPGIAIDGKPKFDLTRFDQAYFDRLRSRIIAARNRGIYISIMLFEGHGLHQSLPPWCWDGHPFNFGNNVNGIDGDPNKDGRGLEIHTLLVPAVTALQKAYISKIIDTVNDLDNVLYEIANESHSKSDMWQNEMIRYIHSVEAGKPNQHPVVYSIALGNDGTELWMSGAEAVSPGWASNDPEFAPYRDNPPLNDGRKIIINDTDHLWGIGGNYQWVWKSFLRGLNPIFMDPYDSSWIQNQPSNRELELIRRNMGYTLTYAKKMDLASMVPRDDLCSTQYCLSNPGKEYLTYAPKQRDRGLEWFDKPNINTWIRWFTMPLGLTTTITIDLSASPGTHRVEWLSPLTGELIDGGIITGGKRQTLASPFLGCAVLYIKALNA